MKKENAGNFPYTRGLYPDMYSSKLWTMRQYAGFTSAQQTNKRFKYLLENGVMGLSVAFDLPTQIVMIQITQCRMEKLGAWASLYQHWII